MSDLSASDPAPDATRAHLVTAVGAVLAEDSLGAAAALQAAVDESSWDVVGHRVEVALRALALDADLEPWRGPLPDAAHPDNGAGQVGEAWSGLWRDVHTVADLIDRAGYPPEVLG